MYDKVEKLKFVVTVKSNVPDMILYNSVLPLEIANNTTKNIWTILVDQIWLLILLFKVWFKYKLLFQQNKLLRLFVLISFNYRLTIILACWWFIKLQYAGATRADNTPFVFIKIEDAVLLFVAFRIQSIRGRLDEYKNSVVSYMFRVLYFPRAIK